MKKNRHYNNNGNRNNSHSEKDDLRRPAAEKDEEIFDDFDDTVQELSDEIEELDVQVLEDELEEDVVNAQDETVLPEDNPLQSQLDEAKAALEKEKKEYLFLMADFDNYRKRVMKEKTELIKNASEKVLKGLLPIVDDFERGIDALRKTEENSSALEGMELIYNKLIKFMSENGVKAMESTDKPFDSEMHEAIASVPTGDDSKKGIVIDTTQKGYLLNDKVLRHAKVVVGE